LQAKAQISIAPSVTGAYPDAASPSIARHTLSQEDAMDRAVRGLERAMLALGDAMGPDLIVGRVTGKLPPDVLHDAVLDVVERHPGLRCKVAGDRFVTLPADPRRVPFHLRTTPPLPGDLRAPWERIVESELRWPLDLRSGVPIRVVQVPEPGGSVIVLAAHHAVVDGTSLLRVLHEVLVAAAARLQGGRADLPELPLSPAALDVVRVPPPVRWAAPLLRRLWARDVLQRQAELRPEALGPIRSICAFRRGSADGLARLREATAREGVTVGQVALAATASALADRGRLALEVEVDLRRHARPAISDERVGLYTGGVRVDVDLDRGFWDAARAAGRQVRSMIGWNLPAFPHVVLDRADPRQVLDDAGCDPVRPGAAPNVSNVGRYPFPVDHGPLVLRDVYGGNGVVPRGAPLMVWLRGMPDGLCYNAVAAAPFVSRQTLERVLDGVVALCESPPAQGTASTALARRTLVG
jgi:hypothetical protein